ncbi:hypothetical protein [Prochlorococcus sp. MIT 1341]|uniref:hypothetical protein n=1 Tax=Prochlorococcus sp. MIT 1341 TaxID=3096221 RepID=UPI002A75E171|nr:hypothetical protein [Prochlorococcus sp. MIT 1341]
MSLIDYIKLTKIELTNLVSMSSYEWGVPIKKIRNQDFLHLKSLQRKLGIYCQLNLKFLYSLFRTKKLFSVSELPRLPLIATYPISLTYISNSPSKIVDKYFGSYQHSTSYYLAMLDKYHISLYLFKEGDHKLISEINFADLSSTFPLKSVLWLLKNFNPFSLLRSQYELQTNLYSLVLSYINPTYIVFPYEGQLWEKLLIRVSSDYNITTKGFIHALNITTPENKRIKFSSSYSPNQLIVLNQYQYDFLYKFMKWPLNRLNIRSLRKRPNSTSISELAKSSLLSDKNKKSILILGSYLPQEDSAAFEIVSKIIKYFNYTEIFYKPHPSLSLKTLETLSETLSIEIKIQIIDKLMNYPYGIILSPSSSSSSIELCTSGVDRLIIYRNSCYLCPNIFYQFNKYIEVLDESSGITKLKQFLKFKKFPNIEFKSYNPLILLEQDIA